MASTPRRPRRSWIRLPRRGPPARSRARAGSGRSAASRRSASSRATFVRARSAAARISGSTWPSSRSATGTKSVRPSPREQLEGAEHDRARGVVEDQRGNQAHAALLGQEVDGRLHLRVVRAVEGGEERLERRPGRGRAGRAGAAPCPRAAHAEEVEVVGAESSVQKIQTRLSAGRRRGQHHVSAVRKTSERMSSEASAWPPRCPTRSMKGLARLRTPSGRGTKSSSVPVRWRELRNVPSAPLRSSAAPSPPPSATPAAPMKTRTGSTQSAGGGRSRGTATPRGRPGRGAPAKLRTMYTVAKNDPARPAGTMRATALLKT